MFDYVSDSTLNSSGTAKQASLYKLKSGRIVSKGDTVTVTLTDRMIDFFVSIGAMEKVGTAYAEYVAENEFERIRKLIFNDLHGRRVL